MNRFVGEEKVHPKVFEVDPRVRDEQTERLGRIRRTRNSEKVERTLEKLKKEAGNENRDGRNRVAKAGSEHNLLPLIIDAVESYATLGEISYALREVWGEQV